ncbi:MAG: hypothetical protein AB7G93_00910 [Bdellovibrionales bacterium]
MESEAFRVKHDLFVGQVAGGELVDSFHIGFALKYEDADHYIVKLWPLPGATYYLAKSRDSDKYTVFTKKIEGEYGVKFQNPVGFALMRSELKEYIEIFLRFPRQRLYMSLYPAA